MHLTILPWSHCLVSAARRFCSRADLGGKWHPEDRKHSTPPRTSTSSVSSNLARICHHRRYSRLTRIMCLLLLALVQPHTVDPLMIDILKRHLLWLTISHGRNKHSARSPRVDIATISLTSPHATPGMAPVTGLLGRNHPACEALLT
jgi:hypothetical protein